MICFDVKTSKNCIRMLFMLFRLDSHEKLKKEQIEFKEGR